MLTIIHTHHLMIIINKSRLFDLSAQFNHLTLSGVEMMESSSSETHKNSISSCFVPLKIYQFLQEYDGRHISYSERVVVDDFPVHGDNVLHDADDG